MSYSAATFFMDYESGSDTARADLVPTAYANNGSGAVRITCSSTAAYSTGAVFDVAGTTGSVYVGGWIVTIVDGTHVDLQGSTFTSNPAAKGTLIPRGGSSKADAWQTVTSGATAARVSPLDTVRMKMSPAPTSLGTCTWSDGGAAASISFTITSSTNATPIVVTKAAHGLTTGDTVTIASHATNTKANGCWKVNVLTSSTFELKNADGTNSVGNGVGGATGTCTQVNHKVVILGAAVTKAIAVVGNQGAKANWTNDNANVTCTVVTSDYREGGECQQIAIGASFTTGLGAHFATGTIDLSGYQQVTFWIKQTVGTVAVANDCRLELSTNTTGTAVVHNIAIPGLVALNRWVPVTVDLAGNMNAAIQSIGWNQLVDRGAQTFLIDCVTAVKASSADDSINLHSLVGKNTGDNTWYAIQSINDVRIVLDRDTNAIGPTVPVGFFGAAGAVTTYKREPIKTTMVASGTAVMTVGDAGTAGNPLTFSGGWDRTNMTSQDGETWFSGQNGLGDAFTCAQAYVTARKIGFVRYNNGAVWTGSNCDVDYFYANNNSGTGLNIQSTGGVGGANISACNNAGSYNIFLGSYVTLSGVAYCTGTPNYGIYFGGLVSVVGPVTNAGGNFTATYFSSPGHRNRCGVVAAAHKCSTAVQFESYTSDCFLAGITTNYNSSQAVASSGGGSVGNMIGSLTTSTNGTSTVVANPAVGVGKSELTIRKMTTDDATVVLRTGMNTHDTRIKFESIVSGISGATHQIVTDGGTITAQTAVRHTASGLAWKFACDSTPTNSHANAYYPLDMALARIACAANALVTVKCFIRRSGTTVQARLTCKGGQLAGVASDVTTVASGATDTWQEETITFTPTESGVVEVIGEVYGSTSEVAYFDDMTITQA